jgi:hypothetical protein
MPKSVFRTLIGVGVLSLLISAPAFARPTLYIVVYGDETNGYASASTEDSQAESVEVEVWLESADSRWDFDSNEGTTSAWAGAQLAINGQYGEWNGYGTHYVDGQWAGDTDHAASVGVSQTTWQLSGQVGSLCNYTKLSSCPANSCGSTSITGQANGGVCDAYKIGNFLIWFPWYHTGNRQCFPLGAGFGSSDPGGCN